MDAFLGGFRASIGQYVQIVRQPPVPVGGSVKNRAFKPAVSHTPIKYKAEDEIITTVFLIGLINNVQNRIADCHNKPDTKTLLDFARRSGQTRPTRLSFRFGPDEKQCTNELQYAGFQTDVDGYVSPAAGWTPTVWRQLTAEMAGWIFQTMKPDYSSSARSGVIHQKVMLTQHGSEMYLIIGSFGNDYLKYIHQDPKKKKDHVISADLQDKLNAHKKDRAYFQQNGKMPPNACLEDLKGAMLQMTRWGPFCMDIERNLYSFMYLIRLMVVAQSREHKESQDAKRQKQ
ncbi:hypothetical protein PGQ11_001814 [Apiospora arundinis]|uniref:Uncharacterized protein n=1 Tax=Apiospora arundinis TaxID=335852 RepID=A0ABR2JG83_9PEZI